MNSFTDNRTPDRVLVTGATGSTGFALLNELQGSSVESIAALSSEAASSRLPDACDYRLCNYDRTSQMAAALEDIDAVFLLVPFDEKMLTWGERFVEQAKLRDVRFILRLSGLAAGPDCGSQMGVLHGQIDEFVKRSGIPYCILRCNAFMQNFTGHYRHMIRRGVLALPEGNARSAFIDTRDIASVAAQILTDPAAHLNRVYDLSGPESLSNAQAVKIISAATGHPVGYRPMSEPETRKAYQKFGISAWPSRIKRLRLVSTSMRQGEKITGTVEELIGRRPGAFHEFATRHRECWAGGESTDPD